MVGLYTAKLKFRYIVTPISQPMTQFSLVTYKPINKKFRDDHGRQILFGNFKSSSWKTIQISKTYFVKILYLFQIRLGSMCRSQVKLEDNPSIRPGVRLPGCHNVCSLLSKRIWTSHNVRSTPHTRHSLLQWPSKSYTERGVVYVLINTILINYTETTSNYNQNNR